MSSTVIAAAGRTPGGSGEHLPRLNLLNHLYRFRNFLRGDPRIARGAEQLGQERALPQLPAQGVLARTGADHQDSHDRSPPRAFRSAASRAARRGHPGPLEKGQHRHARAAEVRAGTVAGPMGRKS